MTNLNEVIVDWTSENSPGGLSVMYFLASGNIVNQRNAIQSMYGGVVARLDTLTTWNVRTSGKVIDDATGTLVGFWGDSNTKSGVGTLSGQPVPNASQVLLRWRTSDIVNGRLLQGRTFVPGLATASLDAGQLAAAAVTAFQAGQAALLAAVPGDLQVWHRPKGGSPGAAHTVTSAATWSELATQRRRR